MLTPATSATLLVDVRSYPSRTRTWAVAERMASTVARERACLGAFLGVVLGRARIFGSFPEMLEMGRKGGGGKCEQKLIDVYPDAHLGCNLRGSTVIAT